MVSLRKLAGVVGPLGLLTGVMGLLNNQKKRATAMSHPIVLNAIERLKESPSALMVLGEPIRNQQMDLTRPDLNYFGEKEGRFQFTAFGPKGRGTLKTSVIHIDDTIPWMITRLELKIHHTSELEPQEYQNKILLLHSAAAPESPSQN